MARKIVITSGKGGVGKTTVTANLGIMLASLGYRVVLIDIDFGLNNLDVVMGLENKVVFDMLDVLEGRCRIKQALIQHQTKKNLYILPSNNLKTASNLSGASIKLMMEGLSKVFDYILLDCPAGIDIGFHRAVSVADEALIVTTPSLTSLRDADKVITILKSYKMQKMGLIVNRARGDLMMVNKMMLPTDIQDMLQTELMGIIPEEDTVFLSSGYELPKKSQTYVAFKLIANNVVNGTKKLLNVTGKYSGFFGSIRRSLKKSI